MNNENLNKSERAFHVPIHIGPKHHVSRNVEAFAANTLNRLNESGAIAIIDEYMARSRLNISWKFEVIPCSPMALIGFHLRCDDVYYQIAINCLQIVEAMDKGFIEFFMKSNAYRAIAILERRAENKFIDSELGDRAEDVQLRVLAFLKYSGVEEAVKEKLSVHGLNLLWVVSSGVYWTDRREIYVSASDKFGQKVCDDIAVRVSSLDGKIRDGSAKNYLVNRILDAVEYRASLN